MPYVYHLPVIHHDSATLPAEAQELLALLVERRPHVIADPLLIRVAQARAQDMADRNYLSHTDPDGYGPNYYVRAAGYALPEEWPTDVDKNYIESIGGGYPTAERVWVAWLGSPPHRSHVLGEGDFYSQQTHVGVGYAENSEALNVYYWVVLSAPPQE